MACLDPTQKVAYEVVTEWAADVQHRKERPIADPKGERVDPLDFLLLGTAGSGKTHTVKCIVQRVREIFHTYDAVLACAHTGVASANIGGGASTIDSIFKLRGPEAGADLDGQKLDEFLSTFEKVELVVIDEISMVGAFQLEMIHRRLQQLRKHVRGHHIGEVDEINYGGVGILKIGDFAQLPPILSTGLLKGSKVEESQNSPKRNKAIAGQRRFHDATYVIRLRRIHRQVGADPFKETTMRLRDAAMTVEDHELWQQHEMTATSGTPAWEDSENLEERAVHLCVERGVCGRINGQRLRGRVEAKADILDGVDSAEGKANRRSDSWRRWAVQIKAHHNRCEATNRKAEEFRQLRSKTHLCLGAPVMLILNNLWDVQTVPLSLINGSRGTVVAILYPEPGEPRADGLDPAVSSSWPCDTESCPLPDFVVVNFPDYQGRAFFGGNLPRTWVPIPPATVRHDSRKSLVRVGVPLKLSWALTVHKSQGLTCKEGVVVDMTVVKAGRNPIATPGIAFVAWTRAVTWSRVAFRSLPPREQFMAIRNRPEFKRRQEFEEWADGKHDELMLKRGITPEKELQSAILSHRPVCRARQSCGSVQACAWRVHLGVIRNAVQHARAHVRSLCLLHRDQGHTEHLHKVTLQRNGRQASEAEVKDLGVMLSQRGVMRRHANPSMCTTDGPEAASGRAATGGIDIDDRYHPRAHHGPPDSGPTLHGPPESAYEKWQAKDISPKATRHHKACRRRCVPHLRDACDRALLQAPSHCGVRPWSPGGEAR